MDTLGFISTVVLVTASGALAPGPLFVVTISEGSQSGAKAGILFSMAHMLVEFTLVMLLAGGLFTIANEPIIRPIVGISGGIVLLVFGAMQIRNSLETKFHEDRIEKKQMRNLLLTGLAFTGLNPFFIVWWLTAGANLVLLSLEFASFTGVLLMYACHVWMDYIWLTSVAHLAKIGTNVARIKLYRIIMTAFGGILIYFGLIFLITSVNL